MSNPQWVFVLLFSFFLCFLPYDQVYYIIYCKKSNPLTKENFCQPVLLGERFLYMNRRTEQLLLGQAAVSRGVCTTSQAAHLEN